MSRLVRSATALLCLIAAGLGRDACAQSTLIALPARRDMVFDHSGQHLYVSTSDGFVRRYNISTAQFDAAYNPGGSLNGIDIAPDDSFLLVAQNNVTGSEATIHKIDLVSGSVTDIKYALLTSDELGAWDIAIKSDGHAFLTGQTAPAYDPYSGWVPLRDLNLATNAIELRTVPSRTDGRGRLYSQAQVHRSADGGHVCFVDPLGSVFTYSSTTNSFSTLHGAGEATAAISRDGGLIAASLAWTTIDRADDFGYVHTLNHMDGGFGFDGQQDVFYGVNSSSDMIDAYDTTDFRKIFELPIGEDVSAGISAFSTGNLVASSSGAHFALSTAGGIRLFSTSPAPAPVPTPTPTLRNPMGLVFDHTGHYLYVSSADGSVLRYDLSLGKFDHAYELGGSLAGIDIAPDDSCLVVAQYYFGLEEGAFHKLDLLTERVTNITYSRVPNAEAGAQDVRIAANGLALVTTLPFSGTGCRPLRQIDLATNEISERSDVPGSCGSHIQSPILRRSADGTRLWIVEAGTYSTFAYTAATNSFGARVQRNQYILQPDAAVSRDGALFGMRLDSVASLESAPDSQPLHDFADCDGLIAFDATKDILYTTNSATDEIVAHDTNTFAELFRFNARTDISPGTIPQILAASHDGSRLAFIGNGGLFVYDVSNGAPPEPTPTPPGPTPTVTISVSPTQIVEGQSATFTVSASAVVTQALTVKFNLSGKAIPNWDYSFDLGTSIEIPAGQSSASIVVQAFVDSNPEKKEKATITLTPGTGYKLAGGKKAKPPKATLTILDPP